MSTEQVEVSRSENVRSDNIENASDDAVEEEEEGLEEEEAWEEEEVEDEQQEDDKEQRDSGVGVDCAEGGDDEGKPISSKRFFAKVNRMVSLKAENLLSGLSHYSLETLQQFDKAARLPGAITIVVTPLGGIDFRISKNLNDIGIVQKYTHRLLWALKVGLEESMLEQSEEDLAHVDKTTIPPGVLERKQSHLKNQQRRGHYFNQLRSRAYELLARKKDNLGEIKYAFCSAKSVCVINHSAKCTEERAKWIWSEDVPFVHVNNLLQDHLLKVTRQYEEDLQIPASERMPEQGENPRCVGSPTHNQLYYSFTIGVPRAKRREGWE